MMQDMTTKHLSQYLKLFLCIYISFLIYNFVAFMAVEHVQQNPNDVLADVSFVADAKFTSYVFCLQNN